jgi:hypothetical protein
MVSSARPKEANILVEFIAEFQDVFAKRVAAMGARMKSTIGLTPATPIPFVSPMQTSLSQANISERHTGRHEETTSF